MMGIYILLAAAGVYFVVLALFLSDQVQWKTFIQALIMLVFGGGGVWFSLKGKQ